MVRTGAWGRSLAALGMTATSVSRADAHCRHFSVLCRLLQLLLPLHLHRPLRLLRPLRPPYIPRDFLPRLDARPGKAELPAPAWCCGTCPDPDLRTQRRAHPRPPRRRLRHRSPHLGMGQLGQQPPQARRWSSAMSSPARSCELGRGGRGGGAARGRGPGHRRRPHRLRPLPAVPARRGASLPAHPDHRRRPRRRVCRLHRDAGLERDAARRHPDRDRRHHGSRWATRSTPCSRRRCPGAPCSCSAAGRSAASRSAWPARPARRS